MQPFITRFLMGAAFLAALAPAAAHAGPKGFLESLHRHTMLASTSPGNGDLNPYAVVVVPQDMGVLHKDDVLVTNFNNISNLQGTGSTIVVYSPATGNVTQFASLPPHLAACPGGVGLTTALTVLKSGWVIVGSAPSKDGSTLTKGDGCLAVLDANGHLAATWKGPLINAPWGDIAAIDRGDTATLFISMSGYDLPGPNVLDPATHYPPILHKATVLRLDLRIPQGQAPVLDKQTVVASGFSARADRDNFLFGPTGLALDTDGTLYVTDG